MEIDEVRCEAADVQDFLAGFRMRAHDGMFHIRILRREFPPFVGVHRRTERMLDAAFRPKARNARFCRDKASCYAGSLNANALIDETEPESGRGKGAQAPALPARRHPDVRTVVRGVSAEPAPS